MYSPLNEDLMFQQMRDREVAMREARALGRGRPPRRRFWRRPASGGVARRTR